MSGLTLSCLRAVLLLSCLAVLGSYGLQFEDHDYDPAYTELYEIEDLALPDEYHPSEKDKKKDDDSYVWRWDVKSFPHPQDSPMSCRRRQPSNICDPDQILKQTEADELDVLIRQLYNATPCICSTCKPSDGGIQFGIAIMEYTSGPHNDATAIASFARNLRSKWKLGECDNDILLVIATKDRLSYTDVGQKTSQYISLQKAIQIFLDNRMYLTERQYFEGLKTMLLSYHEASKVMGHREDVKVANPTELAGITVGAILLLSVAIVAGIIIWRKVKSRKSKNQDKPEYRGDDTISSSWKKTDLKSLFSSFKSSPNSGSYEPCQTKDDTTVELDVTAKTDTEIINTDLEIPEQVEASDFHPESTIARSGSASKMTEAEPRESNNSEGSGSFIIHTFDPKPPPPPLQTNL